MRRLMLVATLLGVVALAAAALHGDSSAPRAVTLPAVPAGTAPLTVGVVANSLLAGGRRKLEQERVRATGVRWIREELPWSTVERFPGLRRWDSVDSLFIDAAKRRLRVLPLLIDSPRWAAAGSLALPRDPNDFGAFAGRAAARYGPGGRFWRLHPKLDARLAPEWFELWNEPYFQAYSTDGVDPARYARMVRASLTAGRGANPRVKWLMAVEETYQAPDGTRGRWIDAIRADDPSLLASVDGFAIHPYSYFSPDDDDSGSPPFRFDRIATIASELAAAGAPSSPLWITELGWSTCTRRPDCVDENEQARRLALAFTQARTTYARRVRALFVYHLHDFPRRPTDDREGYYGVLRNNGSRKPAWSIVRQAALASR